MQMDYTVWLLITLQLASDMTHINTTVRVQRNSSGTPQVENYFITYTKQLLKVNSNVYRKTLNAQKTQLLPNFVPEMNWSMC
jgi:hypothetical protein